MCHHYYTTVCTISTGLQRLKVALSACKQFKIMWLYNNNNNIIYISNAHTLQNHEGQSKIKQNTQSQIFVYTGCVPTFQTCISIMIQLEMTFSVSNEYL